LADEAPLLAFFRTLAPPTQRRIYPLAHPGRTPFLSACPAPSRHAEELAGFLATRSDAPDEEFAKRTARGIMATIGKDKISFVEFVAAANRMRTPSPLKFAGDDPSDNGAGYGDHGNGGEGAGVGDGDLGASLFGIGPNMQRMRSRDGSMEEARTVRGSEMAFPLSPDVPDDAEGLASEVLLTHDPSRLFGHRSDTSDIESSEEEGTDGGDGGQGSLPDTLSSVTEAEQDIESIFILADLDNNGTVDQFELNRALEFIGITNKFERVHMVVGTFFSLSLPALLRMSADPTMPPFSLPSVANRLPI
jgi:hypothetical protein